MRESTKESVNRAKHYSTQLAKYYRNPNVRTSLSVVLSVFVTAFFILVALRPTFVTIASLNKTIEELGKTLVKLEKKRTSLEQASATLSSVSGLIPYLDASIPTDSAEYKTFTKSLEYFAQKNNVILYSESLGGSVLYSSISAPYEGKDREVIDMPMTIRVVGKYEDLSNFYKDIMSMDRLITIDTSSLTKDSSIKELSGQTSLSITGSIHYLANEAAISKSLDVKKKK